MKKEKESLVVNLVSKPNWNQPKNYVKRPTAIAVQKPPHAQKPKTVGNMKCFYCKKLGHFKKDCNKLKANLAKRGNSRNYSIQFNKHVYSIEINLVNVSPHSRWLDTGSPIHITNSLQGYLRKRQPRSDEVHISVGNGMRVAVKAVGVVRLVVGPGLFLDLDNVYFVPSMKRNLVSVSCLVKLVVVF